MFSPLPMALVLFPIYLFCDTYIICQVAWIAARPGMEFAGTESSRKYGDWSIDVNWEPCGA